MENLFITGAAKAVLAAFATVLTYIFGAYDSWMSAVISLVIIDYITGVISAAAKGSLDSSVGYRGILKKAGIFIMIALGNIIDNVTGASGMVRAAVIAFFCANEGISILENCGSLGIPLPQKLYAILEQIRDKGHEQN